MRSRRLLVRVRRMLSPVSVSELQQLQEVFRPGRFVPRKSRNVDAGFSVLPDLKHRARIDEIEDVLIVDLQIGDHDLAVHVLFQLKQSYNLVLT